MIKLIASDLDGTLLQNGATAPDAALFAQVRALKAQGISFCVASGRQHAVLRRLFAPVADDIAFVCENGAASFERNTLLFQTPLPRGDAMQLIAQLQAQPACEVLVSCAQTAYVMPKRQEYLSHMRDFVGAALTIIAKPEEICGDIIKVAAFCPGGAQPYEAMLAPVWERHLTVSRGGKEWLDFTLANKGMALSRIAAAKGVQPHEIMAFGDSENDIPMLYLAGEAYAMTHAAPQVRACAKRTCPNVGAVLQALLENRQ